jgi:hypothetical protein
MSVANKVERIGRILGVQGAFLDGDDVTLWDGLKTVLVMWQLHEDRVLNGRNN